MGMRLLSSPTKERLDSLQWRLKIFSPLMGEGEGEAQNSDP